MSKKFRFLSCLIAVFALALMAVSPVAFAGPNENANENASKAEEPKDESSNGSENTKGNDRKEGYEDNSKTPQETNHGKDADNDGDADSDPNTATEDGHETTNDSPNAHPSGNDKDGEAGGSGNQGRAESNPDDSKGPMRYEGGQGDDKPNGPGGTDRDDQDGNNGCGNDDDFNDDNNGWCGRPTEVEGSTTTPDKPCDSDATMPGIQKCDEVKGEVIERCPNGSEMPANSKKCDEVKGEVTCPDGSAMPASGDIEDCDIDLGENPSIPEDNVLGERIERDKQPAKPAPSVLGVRLSPALNEPVAVAGAVLPFTGGEALIFLAAAMALIAAGVVALKVRRNEA